jgi:hypothetical protein
MYYDQRQLVDQGEKKKIEKCKTDPSMNYNNSNNENQSCHGKPQQVIKKIIIIIVKGMTRK